MQHTKFVIVPMPEHAFFEKTQFKRLLRNHLFSEVAGSAEWQGQSPQWVFHAKGIDTKTPSMLRSIYRH